MDQLKGDSQRRQAEGAARWCLANNVILVEGYKDLGVSAFKGKNASETGALGQFLKLTRDGRIDRGSYLIVESLDRVSRSSVMAAFDIFREIIKAGIRLVTLSDGQVYDTESVERNWTQLIISLSVMARAHEESKMKSLRATASWESWRRTAKEKPMLSRHPFWIRAGADGTWCIIPEKADLVRQMFIWRKGGWGSFKITKQLRADGHISPMGVQWSPCTVSRLLDSRTVLGELGASPNGEPAIPGYYPAILTEELWSSVQKLRKSLRNMRGRSGTNVFSKLAYSKVSGGTLQFTAKGGPYCYLADSARIRFGATGPAARRGWRYEDFKAVFLTVCQQAALTRHHIKPVVNPEVSRLKAELVELEAGINNLLEFLMKHGSAGVETKLREAEAKKTVLESRIRDLQVDATANTRHAADLDWSDDTQLRDNLRATVKRITVDLDSHSFVAEFHDGRTYSVTADKGQVTITTPDDPSQTLAKLNG